LKNLSFILIPRNNNAIKIKNLIQFPANRDFFFDEPSKNMDIMG